jgi:hypothetical protein
MTPTPKELEQTLGVEPHEAEFYAAYLQALENVATEILNPTKKDPDQ